MRQEFKKVFCGILPGISLRLLAYKNLIQFEGSYLHQAGWLRSLKEGRPCDARGNPIPWMNYSIVSLLESRLNASLTIFEYGSGYSTLFYAAHTGKVVSIEYDETWHKIISTHAPENTTIRLISKDVDGSYCRSILSEDKNFDIVVVDGRDRVNCIKQSLSRLTSRGVIILDDSSRPKYAEAFEVVKDQGFRCLRLSGLKPSGRSMHESTIFYKDSNCLAI